VCGMCGVCSVCGVCGGGQEYIYAVGFRSVGFRYL